MTRKMNYNRLVLTFPAALPSLTIPSLTPDLPDLFEACETGQDGEDVDLCPAPELEPSSRVNPSS